MKNETAGFLQSLLTALEPLDLKNSTCSAQCKNCLDKDRCNKQEKIEKSRQFTYFIDVI